MYIYSRFALFCRFGQTTVDTLYLHNHTGNHAIPNSATEITFKDAHLRGNIRVRGYPPNGRFGPCGCLHAT